MTAAAAPLGDALLLAAADAAHAAAGSPGRAAAALLARAVGEDVRGWSVSRRDAALCDVRRARFGERLTALASCPECGERVELSLSVDDVRPRTDDDEVLPARGPRGARYAFRHPTVGDVLDAAAIDDPDAARALLVRRCLVQGRPRRGAADALARALAGADTVVALTCPACAATWDAPFDPGAFLLSEIRAEAARLLGEVAALARAYGWSEEDVLALSPLRRRAYLELAAA